MNLPFCTQQAWMKSGVKWVAAHRDADENRRLRRHGVLHDDAAERDEAAGQQRRQPLGDLGGEVAERRTGAHSESQQRPPDESHNDSIMCK